MKHDLEQDAAPPWLDADQPHDEEVAAIQLQSLLSLLGSESRRVLDLGCGGGRILLPLVDAGHEVVGVDFDEAALERCRSANSAVHLIQHDMTTQWPSSLLNAGAFDVVLCLGNTFMTLHQPTKAIALLEASASLLKNDGAIVLDDLASDFWPELRDGYWQQGVSDEGDAQLVWEPDDAVFTLRLGEQVDAERWSIGEDEDRYRLWTRGMLQVVAAAAGLSVADGELHKHLTIMRPMEMP